jgi:hypothetical protein
MSFAVQSASASAATRAAAHAGVVEHARGLAGQARRPDGAPESTPPKARHVLIEALHEALQPPAPGATGNPASADSHGSPSDGRASRQAFHAFVHALFAELRPIEGEGRHGRGFAWGRTSTTDLAQRLDALVDRLQGVAPDDAAGAAEAAPVRTAPTTDDAVAPATGELAVDAPLLSAFRRLLAATDTGATEGGAASGASGSLVAVLRRVSEALTGDRWPLESAVAGSLLDVTA